MLTIIVINQDNTETIYTTRSTKVAYSIFDKAINAGLVVKSFTTKNGTSLIDRTNETVTWN